MRRFSCVEGGAAGLRGALHSHTTSRAYRLFSPRKLLLLQMAEGGQLRRVNMLYNVSCLRSPSGRRDVEIGRRLGNFGRACGGAEPLQSARGEATAATRGGGDSPPIPGSKRASAAHSSCLHEANPTQTDMEGHCGSSQESFSQPTNTSCEGGSSSFP